MYCHDKAFCWDKQQKVKLAESIHSSEVIY